MKINDNGNQRQTRLATNPGDLNRVRRWAFERMKRIFEWIQEGKYPNCSTIARELEISTKTAGRDIEAMRNGWNLPIEYDQLRFGFYFSRKVGRLPWVPVTEAELFAICISRKVLDLYRGMPFHKHLELAFEKMTRGLDDDEKFTLKNLDLAFSFRPFAREDADARLIELVTRAVSKGRGLRFGYRKPGQERAETREVHPYHVMEFEGRMYLLAYDPSRDGVRLFVLGRMSKAAMTQTRFDRPKDFDPEKEFSTCIGVMRGNGDYNVVIEMDTWLTDILRGRKLHPSQQVQEFPGNGSRLTLRLSGLEEIEQQVLSWGTHATVIRPEELRQRVLKMAREVALKYGVYS